ncbi:MAG: HAMP domain-containing histidine kinase [Oscillospiraceae bacterium]|nr:HAMP domain-containing histidine kinase [Oscillospiraceae bacterium]
MRIKSITLRWVINNLMLVILILVLLVVFLTISMKNYYYLSVYNTIKASANTVSTLILRYHSDNKNVNAEIRSIVENYSLKDKIELMAIDHRSRVTITSSGFDLGSIEMPDYEQALSAEDGIGYYEGRILKDNVIAVTSVIPVESSEFSALRYLVSMRDVDREIFSSALIFACMALIMLLFTLIPGFYFIKSIVLPVRRIGIAARKIAAGDLESRLDVPAKYELGELCATINYMADELNRSERIKNEFISSISHELRTPLTAIRGWGETVLSAGANDSATLSKGMGVIISETERLSQMVEELLDFSFMVDGKFTIIKTKLDILAELGETVLIFGERAKRDGKTIKYEEPEDLPLIFGDKNRLKQVFVNIIDNALKYSQKGDIVLVQAEQTEEYISISIEDTGCGIPEKDQPFITQKFYKSSSSAQYGSGIGLAVVNEIINMHEGLLSIESKVNVGTTVTIKLPINTRKGEDAEISVMDQNEVESQINLSGS